MSDVQIAVIDQQDTQIVLAVPGVQGATGSEIPTGGTADQVLRKNSSTDYDTNWTQVTSAMIANGAIVNEDINNGAAIAGTKISPDFGGQAVTTLGQVNAARVNVTGNTAPSNGIYLPSSNNVAISTNGAGRLFVDSSGNVGIGVSPSEKLHVNGAGIRVDRPGGDPYINFYTSGSANNVAIYGGATTGFRAFVGGSECLRITSNGELKHIGGGTEGDPAVYFAGSAPAKSLVIDSSGRCLVGTSSSRNLVGASYSLQIEGDGTTPYSGLSILNKANSNVPAYLILGKSRGGSGGVDAVSDASGGDGIGDIWFAAADGTDINSASARITCFVDGAVSGDDVPGRLVFSTTADGASSPTPRVQINSTGALQLLSGCTGIDFSGIQTNAAGMTSETLDSYEEGSFTPTVAGSTSAGTASYAYQSARYTKIGRLVYVEILLEWSGGTGTGDLEIAGLPFGSASSTTYPSLSIGYFSAVALTSGNLATAFVNNNGTNILFYEYPTGGGSSTRASYDAAGAIQIAGSYTI